MGQLHSCTSIRVKENSRISHSEGPLKLYLPMGLPPFPPPPYDALSFQDKDIALVF